MESVWLLESLHGYMETDLFGNDANNIKGNGGIYFRPNDNTEISLSSLYGTGEAPLPAGNARYNIKDFVVQMHKLQLKTGGLNAQFYYTHEDAGKTTQSTALGFGIYPFPNRARSGPTIIIEPLSPRPSTLKASVSKYSKLISSD